MDDARLHDLRTLAVDFRDAIERSRSERAAPQLPYFPEGACRLVSRLLALHLGRHAAWHANRLRFVSGHVPGQESFVRHTWLLVDDAIADLAADPFGEARVVVGAPTAFHTSMEALDEQEALSTLAGLAADEINRLRRLLTPIEARLPTFVPRPEPGL